MRTYFFFFLDKISFFSLDKTVNTPWVPPVEHRLSIHSVAVVLRLLRMDILLAIMALITTAFTHLRPSFKAKLDCSNIFNLTSNHSLWF